MSFFHNSYYTRMHIKHDNHSFLRNWCGDHAQFFCTRYNKHSLKARFHYERGKEHSLFVLLIFFALASILTARFNRRSIKETKNALLLTLVVETGLNCHLPICNLCSILFSIIINCSFGCK